MKIVKDPSSRAELTTGQSKIEISELKEMAKKMHGFFVKAIIDIEKGIMAFDAPMHSDLFEFLVNEEGSNPVNLWGINIHPDQNEENLIEFDSMMNIKPGLGNRTRGIENEEIRKKIIEIVNKIVHPVK